ncbi:hypothetical protein BOW53_13590 [Solemya pervernicosa gill symbiont]|uniref:Serine aminopeptidase S33 domain-containing protein n=2 Tax=Gammaproteobacteria incertae sedis TaxID=118884 RepID=A0A1T2L1D9_9GAMM|nr:alpha/beta hydrolase [Candidatus Reidiella endopervernicosa]OOZ38933.1 hypothetical protein BOW53_13590 [Solemya pervernicosa gill symbiont]QKQ26833.1 alpha/beta hydrolase [Candidatus Reidiella endopervernicosa]
MKLLLQGALIVVLALTALNGWFYLQQPAMTFFPSSELIDTPAAWRMDYEDVALKTEDGVDLHGWYLPARDAELTLLFLHGNGGNISHRRDSIAIFHRLGLNVLIIDYRGYGQSRGEPSEQGLYLDAKSAWNYLQREKGVTADRLVIFGRSLGGAVATELASAVHPRAVILESTFTSMRELAAYHFPILTKLVYLRYRFDSAARIASLGAPLLVLHSPEDEIIPFGLGADLFKLATEPKQFVKLRGDHNSGYMLSQPRYQQQLRQFLSIERQMAGGSGVGLAIDRS